MKLEAKGKEDLFRKLSEAYGFFPVTPHIVKEIVERKIEIRLF